MMSNRKANDSQRSIGIYAMVAAAALVAACAQIPDLPPTNKQLTQAQLGLADRSTIEADARWWTGFKDEQLDVLIDHALADSPNLAVARARILRADAVSEAAGATTRPTIGVEADATRERFTANSIYPPPLGGAVVNVGDLNLQLSYDFDFFGRHAAAIAAAVGQQKAAEADAAAARLVLAAQVSRAYLQLAGVLAQAQLLDTQLNDQKQSLDLTQQRVKAGLDNGQNLRTAELPLPEMRRQRLALDEQATLLRHQLAALSAQPQQALATLAPALPQALTLNADSHIGLDLLARRPEVLAARWRAEASLHKIMEAKAAFYPDINLTAFAGFSAIGLPSLLEASSRQYGVGPALNLPILETGALKAQLRGAAADADAAVASYNGVVLDAVRDATDQLSTLQSLRAQSLEQDAGLAHAQQLLSLAEQREHSGLTPKLAVLSAHQGLVQQERGALDLRSRTLDAQVNLMRSLGGAW